MAELFRINVGVAFRFDDAFDKFYTGGDLQSATVRLSYYDASGQTVSNGDILYTEGIPNSQDFFEIQALSDETLNGNGILSVKVSVQYTIPVGSSRVWNVSILNSLPFTFTAYS